ncbi:hypothetical protein EGW08_007363, partial [Elysia chlorotica]
FFFQRALLNKCDFGFLFDIDGVIVRGRKPLPLAKEAFSLLTEDKKFKIPTVFVTNAGNSLRSRKAQQLSEWLGVEVSEDQVVLSHSPLKMFCQFHDKHVLISGQGPIAEIAANIGFKRVTTVEQLAQHYPDLDKMDHTRRKAPPCAFEEYFPRIEAVILFGEPVRWETPLQLIMDVLLTNGKPSDDFSDAPYPHIPILACNTDLLWMSEFKVPRDNPETDIYGGNLYNRYLMRRRQGNMNAEKQRVKLASPDVQFLDEDADDGLSDLEDSLMFQRDSGANIRVIQSLEEDTSGVEKAQVCESILVCTGVYKQTSDIRVSTHNHRDFVIDPSLTTPTHLVSDVYEAVKTVFQKEDYS